MTPWESGRSSHSGARRPEAACSWPAASVAVRERPTGERRLRRARAPLVQSWGSTANGCGHCARSSPRPRERPSCRSVLPFRTGFRYTVLVLSARSPLVTPADAATSASENGQAAPNSISAATQKRTADTWGDRRCEDRNGLARERTCAFGEGSGARHGGAVPERDMVPGGDISRPFGARCRPEGPTLLGSPYAVNPVRPARTPARGTCGRARIRRLPYRPSAVQLSTAFQSSR